MKKKVVLYKDIPDAERLRLEENFSVIAFNGINDENRAQFLSALENAEGVIGASHYMGPEVLDHAKKLEAVSTISVGTDQFDLEYLASRNVPLMHTPSVLTETTADTVFMLIRAPLAERLNYQIWFGKAAGIRASERNTMVLM